MTSLPAAGLLTTSERAAVGEAAAGAVSEGSAREQALGAAVLLRACPLAGPVTELAAWVRVAWTQPRGPDPLSLACWTMRAAMPGRAAG